MVLGVGAQTSHSVSVPRIFILSFAMPQKLNCLGRSHQQIKVVINANRVAVVGVNIQGLFSIIELMRVLVCVFLIESRRKKKENENTSRRIKRRRCVAIVWFMFYILCEEVDGNNKKYIPTASLITRSFP